MWQSTIVPVCQWPSRPGRSFFRFKNRLDVSAETISESLLRDAGMRIEVPNTIPVQVRRRKKDRKHVTKFIDLLDVEQQPRRSSIRRGCGGNKSFPALYVSDCTVGVLAFHSFFFFFFFDSLF